MKKEEYDKVEAELKDFNEFVISMASEEQFIADECETVQEFLSACFKHWTEATRQISSMSREELEARVNNHAASK